MKKIILGALLTFTFFTSSMVAEASTLEETKSVAIEDLTNMRELGLITSDDSLSFMVDFIGNSSSEEYINQTMASFRNLYQQHMRQVTELEEAKKEAIVLLNAMREDNYITTDASLTFLTDFVNSSTTVYEVDRTMADLKVGYNKHVQELSRQKALVVAKEEAIKEVKEMRADGTIESDAALNSFITFIQQAQYIEQIDQLMSGARDRQQAHLSVVAKQKELARVKEEAVDTLKELRAQNVITNDSGLEFMINFIQSSQSVEQINSIMNSLTA